jgi:8-oxo-dGTP diphosphatase
MTAKKMIDPNNTSTKENPVGRFMVAAGAIVELAGTNKILLLKRSEKLDFRPGEWETFYGRIAQGESLDDGLKREAYEETGLTDLKVLRVMRTWHIFRGSQKPENELIGITFVCQTKNKNVKISEEHSEFCWLLPQDALKLTKGSATGIIKDVEEYIKLK